MSVRGRTLAVALPVMGAAGLLSGSGESVPVVGNIAPISEAAAAPRGASVCVPPGAGMFEQGSDPGAAPVARNPRWRVLTGTPFTKSPYGFGVVLPSSGGQLGRVVFKQHPRDWTSIDLRRVKNPKSPCNPNSNPVGAPTPGSEIGPDRVIGGSGESVVRDSNKTGIVAFRKIIEFDPDCDDDTGANGTQVTGDIVFGKSVPVAGFRVNFLGTHYTKSLLGEGVDPNVWHAVDTSAAQQRVAIGATLLKSVVDGNQFRATVRLRTAGGGESLVKLIMDGPQACNTGDVDLGEGDGESPLEIGGEEIQ